MSSIFRFFCFAMAMLVLTTSVCYAHRVVHAPKCALVSAVERLKASNAVFSGRVIEIHESEGMQVVKLNVSKSWKYVRSREVVLTNYIHHEGPYFEQGKSYLVFAYLRNGRLATRGCSGTIAIESVRYEIDELDKWQERNRLPHRAM
ncbi:MAG TPA: hypothetical protein VLB68_25075 [Pyrinomonadaceae bacterium]|nr:hypothetical protein [Pyrinomonadaceae bacterium]